MTRDQAKKIIDEFIQRTDLPKSVKEALEVLAAEPEPAEVEVVAQDQPGEADAVVAASEPPSEDDRGAKKDNPGRAQSSKPAKKRRPKATK